MEMARSSQRGVAAAAAAAVMLVMLAMLVLAAATPVWAEEAAVPTMAERMESFKAMSREKAAQVKGAMNTWKDWAATRVTDLTGKGKATADGAKGTTRDYIAKTAGTLQVSTVQTHETVAGLFNTWGTWIREAVDKVFPSGKLKNPASEAAAFINKHRPKSTDSTDDEL